MPLSFSRTKLALLVALASTLILFAAPRADAAWGDLDSTFAAPNGFTQFIPAGNAYGNSRAIALQPDGKILIAGEGGVDFFGATALIQRLLPDGTPDSSFGASGTLIYSAPAAIAGKRIVAIALQPDGKIVAAGRDATSGVLFRLTTTGALDTTFASPNGYVAFADDLPTDVMVHSSGDIYLSSNADAVDGPPSLRRFNSSGTQIGTFHSTSDSNLAGVTFYGYPTVRLRQSGSALIMSAASEVAGTPRFFAAKLDTTGALDNTWGSGGKATVTFSIGSVVNDLLVQPSGAVILGGATETMGDTAWAIARLTPTGTLDPSFAGGGKLELNLSSSGESVEGLAATPSGGFVAVGYLSDPTDSNYMAAVRTMDANGAPIAGFGSDGMRTLPFAGGSTNFSGVAVQSDGKVIATGHYNPPSNGTLLTARFLNEPAPTPPVPVLGAKVTSPKGKKISAKKLTKFAGSAATTVGSVTKVEIAVQRVDKKLLKKSKRCLWLSSSKVKFKRVKAVKSKCSKPKWLKASGTSKWSFKLKKGKRLPKASYVLQVRVTSGTTVTTFASARKFTVK